mmetsp:Transcript_683/g.1831  ORF Transcript_683/g.1831 Transcript_683/m.1831 type:complete len:164 (-) Transcript_683:155-646(-)
MARTAASERPRVPVRWMAAPLATPLISASTSCHEETPLHIGGRRLAMAVSEFERTAATVTHLARVDQSQVDQGKAVTAETRASHQHLACAGTARPSAATECGGHREHQEVRLGSHCPWFWRNVDSGSGEAATEHTATASEDAGNASKTDGAGARQGCLRATEG